MPIRAGRPLRLELYGLAVAGTVVCFWLSDRIRVQSEIQKKIVSELERPNIVQNNNQQVTIESDAMKLAREILIKEDNGNMPGTK
jgi:hypothetical protein